MLGFRQIGHLGTLDPLATGVLVLLLGRATRLAQFYVGRRKRYDSTFRFGFATDTYDADGTPLGPDAAPQLDRAEIERLAAARIGRFPQMPPPYSAKKIHGRPAHELARKNKPVELKAVEIEVYDFRVNEVSGSLAKVSDRMRRRHLHPFAGARHGRGARLRRAPGGNRAHRGRRIHARPGRETRGPRARRAGGRPGALRHSARTPAARIAERHRACRMLEKRVRHGSKFNVQIAQIQPGRASAAQGATAELNSGEWKPARLRVFNQQEHLIAIAEAVVPRTYQPVVVLEAEA